MELCRLTYVSLTTRSGIPRIIPSFHRGEIKKKKRYSDRAVDLVRFYLTLFSSVFFTLHKLACLLSACAKDLIRVKLGFEKKNLSLISRSTSVPLDL